MTESEIFKQLVEHKNCTFEQYEDHKIYDVLTKLINSEEEYANSFLKKNIKLSKTSNLFKVLSFEIFGKTKKVTNYDIDYILNNIDVSVPIETYKNCYILDFIDTSNVIKIFKKIVESRYKLKVNHMEKIIIYVSKNFVPIVKIINKYIDGTINFRSLFEHIMPDPTYESFYELIDKINLIDPLKINNIPTDAGNFIYGEMSACDLLLEQTQFLEVLMDREFVPNNDTLDIACTYRNYSVIKHIIDLFKISPTIEHYNKLISESDRANPSPKNVANIIDLFLNCGLKLTTNDIIAAAKNNYYANNIDKIITSDDKLDLMIWCRKNKFHKYDRSIEEYTNRFVENESFCHKKAKEVLKGWFDEQMGDDMRRIDLVKFVPNRKSGVLLEYPVCKLKGGQETSWERNWDELVFADHPKFWNEYVPTFNECVDTYESYPIAVIDVVCVSKGQPAWGIEICHKNPVSKEKIDKLKKFGVTNLIEIDAEWILRQTKIPTQLKYRRLI